jgi:hypothetical protein
VPAGALDYPRGGSSTSIALDPDTTDPSETSRAQSLAFFQAMPAPLNNPAADNTLLWVAGGIAAALVLSKALGGHR